MYTDDREDTFFSKTTRKMMLTFSIIGAAVFTPMLFPQIRFLIISFVERYIVFRDLNYTYWNNLLFEGSLAGVFLSAGLFALLCPLVIRFLLKNYALTRYLLLLPVILGFLIVTFFSLFVIIGLTMIIYTEFHSAKKTAKLQRIVIPGRRIFAGYTVAAVCLIGDLAGDFYSLKTRQFQMLHYKQQTLDILEAYYPWTDTGAAYKQIGILEKNNWSIFYRRVSKTGLIP